MFKVLRTNNSVIVSIVYMYVNLLSLKLLVGWVKRNSTESQETLQKKNFNVERSNKH